MRIAMSVKVGVAYPENVAEDLEARAIADNHGGVWSGESGTCDLIWRRAPRKLGTKDW